MAGWFKVYRSIWRSEDFLDEPFTDREAFLWLVSEAAFEDCELEAGGKVIALQRGQVAHSIRHLAEQFGWPVSRVRRFLTRHTKRHTIRHTSGGAGGTPVTVITICNYERFQSKDPQCGTPKDDQAAHQAAHQAAQDIRNTKKSKNSPPTPPELPLSDQATDLEAECATIDEVAEAVRIYTEVCVPAGLREIAKVTADRRKTIKARLSEHGLSGWRAACEAAAASPFWRGEEAGRDGKPFKGGLDNLARPKNCVNLIERHGELIARDSRRKPALKDQPAHRRLDDGADEIRAMGIAI